MAVSNSFSTRLWRLIQANVDALLAGGSSPTKNEYAVDGAISIETQTAIITKGSAAALTLGVPVAADDGKFIVLIKGSDFSHTITAAAANILVDSFSGEAGNRLTLSGPLGHTTTLHIANGKYWFSLYGSGLVSDV